MNSNFLNTANGDIIQSPITFKPTEKALNRGSSIIESLPFLSFGEQSFFMSFIYLNNWLRSILAFNKVSQLVATIASIGNYILRMKFAVGDSCFTKNPTSYSAIMGRTSANCLNQGRVVS